MQPISGSSGRVGVSEKHETHAAALFLGPSYTKRQYQYCDNSAMMLVILFLLKTMESLQKGVQPIFK